MSIDEQVETPRWSLTEQCDMTGTHLCGYASATLAELQRLFGQPHTKPYDYGRKMTHWWFFTKTTEYEPIQLYRRVTEPSSSLKDDDMHVWHVAAHTYWTAHDFLLWLEVQLRKVRDRQSADVAPIGVWLLPPGIYFYPR